MRGTGRLAGALLALLVCAAPPAAAADDGTSWGLVARGGLFGVPDVLVDEVFVEHPHISGTFGGAEVRWFGDGGGRGISSVGIAVDHGRAQADGTWRNDPGDRVVQASGELTMTAITVTGYWGILPSLPVHPYLGLGLGAAHFSAEYDEDGEPVSEAGWLPVVHVPVGIAFELGRHLQLAAEARFLGAFSGGAALLLRF